jgi:hypothetical protein
MYVTQTALSTKKHLNTSYHIAAAVGFTTFETAKNLKDFTQYYL